MGSARRSMRLKDKAPVPAAPSGVKKTTRKSKSSAAASAVAPASKGRKSKRTSKAVAAKVDEPVAVQVDEPSDMFPARDVVDEEGNPVDTGTLEYCLIFLYPRANTPGCTTQACGFRDGIEKLKEAGYSVFGLSYDTPAAQKKWKEKHDLPYRFLCDKPGKDNLIREIGCHKAQKGIKRSHFVLGAEGTIVHKLIDIKPKDSITKAIAFCEENPNPSGAKAKEDEGDAEMADVDAKDDDAEMKDEKADDDAKDATEAKDEADADDAKEAEAKDGPKAETGEAMADDADNAKDKETEPAADKPAEEEPSTEKPMEEKSMDIEPAEEKPKDKAAPAEDTKEAEAAAEENKDVPVDAKADDKEKATEAEKAVESEKDGGDAAANIVANDGKVTEVEEALVDAGKAIGNGEVGDTKASEDAKAEGEGDLKMEEAAKDVKTGEEKDKETADVAPAATLS